MEDLCQDIALRELNVPPRDPLFGQWETQAGNRDPDVDDQEATFPRGRGWEPRGQPPQPTVPSTRGRHRMSHKYSSHWIVTGYPTHKHLQWQSHTGEDGSVFYGSVFEQWYHNGTMCKRPLSGISGLGEHSKIIKWGSSTYGPVHGSYC